MCVRLVLCKIIFFFQEHKVCTGWHFMALSYALILFMQIGTSFCSPGDINTVTSCFHSTVATIMERWEFQSVFCCEF